MSIEDTLLPGLLRAAVPSAASDEEADSPDTILGLAVSLGRLQRHAQALGCDEAAFLVSLAIGTLEEHLPKVTN